MENYLEVTAIEPTKPATDGRNYQQVWFQEYKLLPGNKRLYTNQPERSVNFWDQGPPSAKGMKDFSKGDPLFDKLSIGSVVEGSILTERVLPYTIPGSEANGELEQYTMIVFPHENKFTKFERAGHPIVDEDGTVHERASLGTRTAASVTEEIAEEQESTEKY